MQSMTGYGKAEYNEDGISLVVEVKTVNNRYLDIVPKYPRVFMKYDDIIRKTIGASLSRGRIELMILLKESEEASKPVVIDMTLAQSYYNAYKQLSENFPGLKDDFSISSLMRSPDVISEQLSEDDEKYKDILLSTLQMALDNLNAMRKVEGDKLLVDLYSRADTIEEIVAKISEKAPLVQKEYCNKLKERVAEYLDGVQIDETRLLQEVAIFADKSNIDEELTRLKSHISQFRQILKQENCGKRLDFLIQEFNREANTICSKANDLAITDLALKLKCEIEKIREQIQNIE